MKVAIIRIRKFFLLGIIMTIILISMNMALVFSIPVEKTILKIHTMRYSSFNEGLPIVFVGKLTDEAGKGVAYSKIVIKGDAPCPTDHIIASGTTNKNGRFWIMTMARIWDEKDNLVKTYAEFAGSSEFLPSKSNVQIIVVYPARGEKAC